MVRQYHRLNGSEFEQTPRDSDGQGSLACYSPWGGKMSDTTQRLNSNNNRGITPWLSNPYDCSALRSYNSLHSEEGKTTGPWSEQGHEGAGGFSWALKDGQVEMGEKKAEESGKMEENKSERSLGPHRPVQLKRRAVEGQQEDRRMEGKVRWGSPQTGTLHLTHQLQTTMPTIRRFFRNPIHEFSMRRTFTDMNWHLRGGWLHAPMVRVLNVPREGSASQQSQTSLAWCLSSRNKGKARVKGRDLKVNCPPIRLTEAYPRAHRTLRELWVLGPLCLMEQSSLQPLYLTVKISREESDCVQPWSTQLCVCVCVCAGVVRKGPGAVRDVLRRKWRRACTLKGKLNAGFLWLL